MDILYIFLLCVAILFSPIVLCFFVKTWNRVPGRIGEFFYELGKLTLALLITFLIGSFGFDVLKDIGTTLVAVLLLTRWLVRSCKVETEFQRRLRFSEMCLKNATKKQITDINDYFTGGVSHGLIEDALGTRENPKGGYRSGLAPMIKGVSNGTLLLLDVLAGDSGDGDSRFTRLLATKEDAEILTELQKEREKLLAEVKWLGGGVGIVSSERPIAHGCAFASHPNPKTRGGHELKLLIVRTEDDVRLCMQPPPVFQDGEFVGFRSHLSEIGKIFSLLRPIAGLEGFPENGLFVIRKKFINISDGSIVQKSKELAKWRNTIS
ncbi:MAG: hypothetical protein CL685_02620 [Candidatus Magasanikbacteria bacterium]|nr:hypothetical protein [Candidatus Magasanikbacteria bacterium]|tara:strand:+ start:2024 stop:2989 length:966 start_codon:yes stop_codon:yes gene_type:complete